MQIIMDNGKASPKFESEFPTATALYYTNSGLKKYTMGAIDVSEIIAEEMKELYRRKFGHGCNLIYVFYYIYQRKNQWYLVAYNVQNNTSVKVDVQLTQAEIDKLKCLNIEKLY